MVEECKLRVVYVAPPQPPSPVQEGSEEGSSPRGSVTENGNGNGSDSTTVGSSLIPCLCLSFFFLYKKSIGINWDTFLL